MTSVTERLADTLVGLRMPHALEALPLIVRSLEPTVFTHLFLVDDYLVIDKFVLAF